jgi:signal peptidase I
MRSLTQWLWTVAVAIVVVLGFQAEVAKPFRIPSASMEPTLHCARPADGCAARFSDRVIACEICYRFSSPHRGQIVVFHAPSDACGTGGIFVKRLIGMPGDVVTELADGRVAIDGRALDEPYVPAVARTHDEYRGQSWRVPEGSYFMLGDNRNNSCDSRNWGAVPRDRMIGPVVMTYWPPTRLAF